MIGLGTSINRGGFVSSGGGPLYSKEVIESGDGWSLINVEGSPTIEYNQTAPDSSTGWMKITFDQTQTDYWYLRNSSILSGQVSGGTQGTIKYDLYLHNAALWGDNTADDDDIISWRTSMFTNSSPVNVSTDSVTSINFSSTASFPYSIIDITNGIINDDKDLPLANAEFYMKNLEITVS
jgi:hypothetical protein